MPRTKRAGASGPEDDLVNFELSPSSRFRMVMPTPDSSMINYTNQNQPTKPHESFRLRAQAPYELEQNKENMRTNDAAPPSEPPSEKRVDASLHKIDEAYKFHEHFVQQMVRQGVPQNSELI